MPERIDADVCVVGAGYAGLTAARRLSQGARSVVVLEARERGEAREEDRRLRVARGVARTLEAVGGPGPGPARPLNGSIALRDSDGAVVTATAGSDGVFLVQVPIGTYAITGRSPLYESGNTDCSSSGPATLMVGATIHVVVVCPER